MEKRRFDQPDLLLGVFLVAVAVVAFAATHHLAMGSVADMGPGFMPRVIATGLLGFGLFFTGRGLIGPAGARALDPVKLRPLAGVLAAVAVFALLVVTAGLALASLAVIVTASFASSETRPLETILFGTALTAGTVMLFVKALSLPVPIWPW